MAIRPDQPLFSYGTLQIREVQLETFGRPLERDPDVLPGFTVEYAELDDPRRSGTGETVLPVVRATGNALDKVTGAVLLLTQEELDAADEYEMSLYRRVRVQLQSGRAAWAYVSV